MWEGEDMFLLRYGAQRGRCRILSCKLAARLRVARDDHTRSLQLALVVAEGFAQLNFTWLLKDVRRRRFCLCIGRHGMFQSLLHLKN